MIFTSHLKLNLHELQNRHPEKQSLSDYSYAQSRFEHPKIIVRDFIAGMTDAFFWKLVHEFDPTLNFEIEERY